MVLIRYLITVFLLLHYFVLSQKLLCQDVIKNAHSHNDYLNKNPLFNAVENKFKSIEVDIFLLNSNLYVGHGWLQIRKERTIEKLYLDPLWKQYNENRGYIYQNNISLYLLVDIKTASKKTHNVLGEILHYYKPMLSYVVSDSLIQGAVTIILSGNKPDIEDIKNIEERFVFMDGRLSDVGKNISNIIMPIISMNWLDHFTWSGIGLMPDKELIILNEIVQKVHLENKQIRFWASPDNKGGWITLENVGVDLISTDKINQFSTYKIQN